MYFCVVQFSYPHIYLSCWNRKLRFSVYWAGCVTLSAFWKTHRCERGVSLILNSEDNHIWIFSTLQFFLFTPVFWDGVWKAVCQHACTLLFCVWVWECESVCVCVCVCERVWVECVCVCVRACVCEWSVCEWSVGVCVWERVWCEWRCVWEGVRWVCGVWGWECVCVCVWCVCERVWEREHACESACEWCEREWCEWSVCESVWVGVCVLWCVGACVWEREHACESAWECVWERVCVSGVCVRACEWSVCVWECESVCVWVECVCVRVSVCKWVLMWGFGYSQRWWYEQRVIWRLWMWSLSDSRADPITGLCFTQMPYTQQKELSVQSDLMDKLRPPELVYYTTSCQLWRAFRWYGQCQLVAATIAMNVLKRA